MAEVDSSLPDIPCGRPVTESRFERAYALVDDRRRAWIKTAVACAYSFAEESPGAALKEFVVCSGGLAHRVRREPVAWAAVAFGPRSSPAQVVAALLPAVAAGVPHVAALCLAGRNAPAPPLLVALELAGQEHVALVSARRLPACIADMRKNLGPGLVLDLWSGPAAGLPPLPARLWRPERPVMPAAWLDSERSLDLEALAFAHPGTQVHVWGKAGAIPEGSFVLHSGTFGEFARQGYFPAAVPVRRLDALAGKAPLALGPGMESCFIWPGLVPELFLQQSVCCAAQQS